MGLFDVWTWVTLFRYVSSTLINLALIPLPWVLAIIGLTIMVPTGFWDRETPLESAIRIPMLFGPLALLAVFMLFVWWKPPGITGGADFKHRFYPLQKSVLIAAVSWLLADLFILGIAAAYWLDANLAELLAAAGLSSATLLGTAVSAYNFFSKVAEGGVQAKDSGVKKLLGAPAGILGFVALAVLLLTAYYALDIAFFPDLPTTRDISQGLVVMTLAAFTVAAVVLFVPARWFLNTFSLQALYRRGLRKAYVL
ncbi:MAG: hypothetical protein O2812_05225, partial [Chloroflexi bacterium]|nr:hypothetical protein [Chloroflexota bacterium]